MYRRHLSNLSSKIADIFKHISQFIFVPLGIGALIAFSSLLAAQCVKAAELPTLASSFKPLVIPDLNTTSTSRVMFQDSQGIMWLGTDSALVRYDGYDSVFFLNEPKNYKSLSNDFIMSITEDKDQNLWVGTENGLNRLNKHDGTFERYFVMSDPLDDSVNRSIYDLFIDNKKRLWVAMASGIQLYNAQTNTFTKYQPGNIKFSHKGKGEIIYGAINQDDNGFLWLGTSSGGLVQFNPEDKSFVQYSSHKDNPNRLFDEDDRSNYISNVERLSSEFLLLATGKGLLKFNIRTKIATAVLPERTKTWNWVRSASKDKSGNWWLAEDFGLYRLSADLSELFKYKASNIETLEPEIQGAATVFVDRENNKWASFYNSGIFYSPNNSNQVKKIELRKNSFIENNSKISNALETKNYLWVGGRKGLSKINKENGIPQWFDLKSDNPKKNLGSVHNLHLDKNKSLWLSRDQGLTSISSEGEINHIPAIINGRKNTNPLYSVVADYKGQIWAGIHPFGLSIYDKTKNQFRMFEKTKEMGIGRYLTLLEISDDRKELYIVDGNVGLFRYNIETEEYKRFNDTVNGTGITGMRKIDNETLLLTYGKNFVRRVNLLTEAVETIDLPISRVGCLVEGTNNHLWLAQYQGGMYRWNKKTNELKQFKSFEGIPRKGLTGSYCGQLSKEGFWFASYEGLLFARSNQQEVTESVKPNTIITEIKLADKKVDPKFYSEQLLNLNTANKDIQNSIFTFDHNQGPLFIKFAALSFTEAQANKYKYRVTGLRDDWIEVDAKNRSAILSYIPAGKYQFVVLGSNAAGIWSDNPAVFNFEVLPPIWLSTLAKVTYLFLIFSTLISFYWLRTRALKRRAAMLERTICERTNELSSEKQVVEKLLVRKTEEFSNMSHEFRTPLTLVLGPIEQLLNKCLDESDKKRLSTIQRNAYRLLRMVDQLLNIEVFRVKAITQKSQQNTGQIIRNLTDAFSELASEKEIKLRCINCVDIVCQLVPDSLEKIVLNLLSNAIKYTQPGGSINVETLRTTNNTLRIIISDTGVGIDANKLDTIFERYNRILDENSEKVVGAGIGLALVKELVEFHQGTIIVKSQLGHGSIFTVDLPIEGEVEQSETMINDTTETIALELASLSHQASFSRIESQSLKETTNSEKVTVLIVEDNIDMLRYIAESIEEDYQIITAQNGREGLELAIKEVPDLIISDVMMPKMDGYQLTNELRNNEITDQIPIILLTARGDKESRMKGWYEKADEYLCKPFDVDELKVRLDNLLEIRNIIKKRFAENVFVESKTRIVHKISDLDEGRSEQQQKFVTKLNLALESIYTESSITIADFASGVAMSERQLFRKLKSILDLTPSEYLKRFRLEKSKLILEQGQSVNYVTFEVGFSTQSNFAKCFKAQFGMSPSDYKKAGGF